MILQTQLSIYFSTQTIPFVDDLLTIFSDFEMAAKVLFINDVTQLLINY
jgi:hypothetical protein